MTPTRLAVQIDRDSPYHLVHAANGCPQFGGSVAEATVEIRNQFIRKVYTILTVQLVVTGAVSGLSFMSDSYKAWIQSHPAIVWVSVRPPSPLPLPPSTPPC
jgi:hypothetical protein